MSEISFRKLETTETDLIEQIAEWYFHEWKIPTERTINRLKNRSHEDIIFQLVLQKNNEVVATGGLYNDVGLLHVQPEFKKLGPWVALLYTEQYNRNYGYGQKLLEIIQQTSKEIGLNKIYLYTYSAERLYLRMNWIPIERVNYNGHDTVIMLKEL